MQSQWIATEDAQVGDRLICSLSDAIAYPTITGWADRVLNLGEAGTVTHRTFTVTGDVPWWVDYDIMQRTGSIGGVYSPGQVCIVARVQPVITQCDCGFLPAMPAGTPLAADVMLMWAAGRAGLN